MARYEEIELLMRVGEYQEGNDELSDEAIRKHDMIQAFLRQRSDEHFSLEDVCEHLQELAE